MLRASSLGLHHLQRFGRISSKHIRAVCLQAREMSLVSGFLKKTPLMMDRTASRLRNRSGSVQAPNETLEGSLGCTGKCHNLVHRAVRRHLHSLSTFALKQRAGHHIRRWVDQTTSPYGREMRRVFGKHLVRAAGSQTLALKDNSEHPSSEWFIVDHTKGASGDSTSDITEQSHFEKNLSAGEENIDISAANTPATDKRKGRIKRLQRIMLTSSSVPHAWDAYQALLASATGRESCAIIPLLHLHRLANLIASSKPRTRAVFLRLLDVLSRIRRSGGVIYLWEWNALIDCAGKGWRKTRTEDYKTALGVFNDMITGPRNLPANEEGVIPHQKLEPDIITYTTLLNIALQSSNPSAIRHASSLLRTSGLYPNRITNLVLLCYSMGTDKLSGVRDIINKMAEEGQEIGLDGINAFLWAYVHEGQFDVAFRVYYHLQSHVSHATDVQTSSGSHDSDGDKSGNDAVHGEFVEGLFIPKEMRPNEITYTLMIQGLAYHGRLIEALQIWTNMLSSPKRPLSKRKSSAKASPPEVPEHYGPSLPVFRALFCGFARHGQPPTSTEFSSRLSHLYSQPSPWTLDNLSSLFDAFLDLPGHVKPKDRLLYWIMVAFGKTSGNDTIKLREVWNRIEDRFSGSWSGRMGKLARTFSRKNRGNGQG